MENPLQSYGASPAIWDYTVLPGSTCHLTQVNVLHLNLAWQAGTRFVYPRRMEGWVDLGVGYILRWFTSPL